MAGEDGRAYADRHCESTDTTDMEGSAQGSPWGQTRYREDIRGRHPEVDESPDICRQNIFGRLLFSLANNSDPADDAALQTFVVSP